MAHSGELEIGFVVDGVGWDCAGKMGWLAGGLMSIWEDGRCLREAVIFKSTRVYQCIISRSDPSGPFHACPVSTRVLAYFFIYIRPSFFACMRVDSLELNCMFRVSMYSLSPAPTRRLYPISASPFPSQPLTTPAPPDHLQSPFLLLSNLNLR